MTHTEEWSVPVTPDWEEFRACILREGTPERVHHIELFLDWEVRVAIAKRFHLWDDLDPDVWETPLRREVRMQRFLGFDYVRQGIDAIEMPLNRTVTEDTAEIKREGGRNYIDETKGPITTWEEFEAYPWPDLEALTTRALAWYQENLPDDMCVIGGGGSGHFAEMLTWLMGYEALCYALFDQRDLVKAIADRMMEIYTSTMTQILQYDRVKICWGSDDMGFKTGPMIGPDDLREFVLPGHKRMAAMSHAAGRPYILHSCGNLFSIYEDLIEDVEIDGKHSFEDTIEDVRELKPNIGSRIALLGGIDLDFMCRHDEAAIRQRVRETLDICQIGGGYCLGTGNSVANYIPLENYLAMVDEGRRYRG